MPAAINDFTHVLAYILFVFYFLYFIFLFVFFFVFPPSRSNIRGNLFATTFLLLLFPFCSVTKKKKKSHFNRAAKMNPIYIHTKTPRPNQKWIFRNRYTTHYRCCTSSRCNIVTINVISLRFRLNHGKPIKHELAVK